MFRIFALNHIQQQKNQSRRNPSNKEIICIDVKSSISEWTRIINKHEQDIDVMEAVNTLVGEDREFNGATVRFYTLAESDQYEFNLIKNTPVTSAEKKTIEESIRELFGSPLSQE